MALVGDGGDVEVAVDDLDVAGGLDVGGVHLGRPADVEGQRDRVLGEALQVQVLEVEDDLGHVLLDVRDRGELVGHAVDLDRGDRRPPQRGEQHPPQGVAEGGAETGLERLDLELAERVGAALEPLDRGRNRNRSVNSQLEEKTSLGF